MICLRFSAPFLESFWRTTKYEHLHSVTNTQTGQQKQTLIGHGVLHRSQEKWLNDGGRCFGEPRVKTQDSEHTILRLDSMNCECDWRASTGSPPSRMIPT